MNVKTVEPVGTEGTDMSSSYSIKEDCIPEKIRKIFDYDPNKYFQVYYMNEQSQIMVKNHWLFEGRDKQYRDYVYAEMSGTCVRVVVTFQGRTSWNDNYSGAGNSNIQQGERVEIILHGRFIP